MLTTWTPVHMPEKEEIKERLQTARSLLYDYQMKIKEHKIPVIVPVSYTHLTLPTNSRV